MKLSKYLLPTLREPGLRGKNTLLGGQPEPAGGLNMILFAVQTLVVKLAQAGLRPIALRPDALDLGRRVGVMSRAGAYLSPLALRMIGIFEARMQ